MRKILIYFTAAVLSVIMLAGCGSDNQNEDDKSGKTDQNSGEKLPEESVTSGSDKQVAEGDETAPYEEVTEEGMKPLYGKDIKDGEYEIKVNSSSSMFNITACRLIVRDGKMTAVMSMNGKGYSKLFMGTGNDAVNGAESDFIPYEETEEGIHTFTVPVEALDMGISCAAFSKNKEKWYDRTLVFRADSLPKEAFKDGLITSVESLSLEDGEYTVEVVLSGGSGKAKLQPEAELFIEDGKAYAVIVWSSSNYDYMKIDDIKYDNIAEQGNSAFKIPVSGFDCKLPVIADTTAMGTPHEIEYTIYFKSDTIKQRQG